MVSVMILAALIANGMDTKVSNVYSPLYTYRYDQNLENIGIALQDPMTEGWYDQSIKETIINTNEKNRPTRNPSVDKRGITSTRIRGWCGVPCTVATGACNCG